MFGNPAAAARTCVYGVRPQRGAGGGPVVFYVYTAGSDNVVHKVDPDGNTVWEYTVHSSSVNDVTVDADGYVYSASQDNEVHKIDPDGNNVWAYTGHTDMVRGVAVGLG